MSSFIFTAEENLKLIELRNHPEMRKKFLTHKTNPIAKRKLWEEICAQVNPKLPHVEYSKRYHRLVRQYKLNKVLEQTKGESCIRWQYWEAMKKFDILNSIQEDKENVKKSDNDIAIDVETLPIFEKKKQKRCAYKTTENNVHENKIVPVKVKATSNVKNKTKKVKVAEIKIEKNNGDANLKTLQLEATAKSISEDVAEIKRYLMNIMEILKEGDKKKNKK